jgi:hypothetical protein
MPAPVVHRREHPWVQERPVCRHRWRQRHRLPWAVRSPARLTPGRPRLPDPVQEPTSRSETCAGSTVRQQGNRNRDHSPRPPRSSSRSCAATGLCGYPVRRRRHPGRVLSSPVRAKIATSTVKPADRQTASRQRALPPAPTIVTPGASELVLINKRTQGGDREDIT